MLDRGIKVCPTGLEIASKLFLGEPDKTAAWNHM
jgi:hypothetical protein